MTSLLWFKRDLRLDDHPALTLAMDLGNVVPVYIVEPELWSQPEHSARHYGFVTDSLRDLRDALRRRGSDLIVRFGLAVPVLEKLRQQTGAAHLVSHEETGTGWTYARDRSVAVWARGTGVVWHELAQSGVVRRLSGRDGWAAVRNRFMAAPVLNAPNVLPAVALSSDALPGAADLGLTDDAPNRQPGGRSAGLALLRSFLETRGRPYRQAMSSPIAGAVACSRLSPHLAFGTLSLREVVQATAARQRQARTDRDGWSASLKSFQSRLAWHDHFVQKLEDEPQIDHRNMHSAYDGLRPALPDDGSLKAWKTGQTGVPFVDACMRSLIHTGWLNFRMRSMLMSFSSYHLWLDWREPGLHLARMFTDYEPGIHWSQVQMQSGTTGINTPRIYNPVKQGQDQDPTGAFTRAWVPELVDVPDAVLQTPWVWSEADRLHYPAPVVDLAQAGRMARDRIWGMRRDPAHRNEAARVIHKHASRKDGAGHFQNDRTTKPRRRSKQDPAQLSLDL